MILVQGKVERSASTETSSTTPASSAPAASSSAHAASTPASAPTPASASNSASEKKGPTHVSFEAFLRTRRFETGALAGALRYSPIKLEKGKMNRMPMSVTLQHQKYRHVDHLEYMNAQEVQNFVAYWRSQHMIEQRCG